MPRNAQCDDCGKRFVTRSAMKQHRYEAHPSDERLNEIKAVCHKCNNEFQYAITLNSHLLKCVKEKPMKKWDCKDCDTSWFSYSAVCKHYAEVHKRIAHICHICGVHVKSRFTLPLHMKSVHDKIKDIPCNYCHEVSLLS